MGQVVHIEEVYRPLSRPKVRRCDLRDELQPLNWWLGSSSEPSQINNDVVWLIHSAWVHHSLLSLSVTQMLYEELTNPEDMVHELFHVDSICLDLGGKQDEYRNVFVLGRRFKIEELQKEPPYMWWGAINE